MNVYARCFRWFVVLGIVQDLVMALPGVFFPRTVLGVLGIEVDDPAWPAFAALLLVLLGLFVLLGKPRGQPTGAYAASVGYFACLGLGFITVELVLLQNLTLLLGHPIFTLSILLFSLLLAGGLGSAMSRHVPGRRACLIVTGLGVIWAVALPHLVPMLLPLPLAARVAIAILIILPIGLAMGIPFPRGLRRAGALQTGAGRAGATGLRGAGRRAAASPGQEARDPARAGRRGGEVRARRGPPGPTGDLDDIAHEPLLRPRDRQPALEPLLRSGSRAPRG